jgi:hypothetical protein
MRLKLFTILATTAFGLSAGGAAFAQTDTTKPDTATPSKSSKSSTDKSSADKASSKSASKSSASAAASGDTQASTAKLNRQIALIDVYLTQAIDNAKLLATLTGSQGAAGAGSATGMSPSGTTPSATPGSATPSTTSPGQPANPGGSSPSSATPDTSSAKPSATASSAGAMSFKPDATVINEAKTNLNSALDKAASHVASLRGLKNDLAASATGEDRVAKLTQLEQSFKDAKTAARKINAAKASDLSTAVDETGSQLMAAQNLFRDIARWTNYTMLSDVRLGTVPVRGTEPSKDLNTPANKDLNKDINKDINDHDLNKDMNKSMDKDTSKPSDTDMNKDLNAPGKSGSPSTPSNPSNPGSPSQSPSKPGGTTY